MSQTLVLQQLFSSEFHTQYERRQSFLRGCVTVKGVASADRYSFIVPQVATAAVERGANGQIPIASYGQDAVTCQLKEYAKIIEIRNFNVYSSSVPQRENMQQQCVTAINQKTDELLLSEFQTATNNTGAATTASLSWLLTAVKILDANDVPDDGERYGALTPAAWGQLMKVDQFTNSRYVSDQPFMKYMPMREWMGVKWFKFTGLPNMGLSTAKCYLWHKAAIGHALNQGEMQVAIGRDEKQDTSWSRVSAYMGAKLLLNNGIVEMAHNDATAL